MYTSPIEIIYNDFRSEIEEQIYKCIYNFNIHVDKEELLKALAYDRNQYKIGYEDGLYNGFEALKEIKEIIDKSTDYLGCIGAIDVLEDIKRVIDEIFSNSGKGVNNED